MSVLERVVRPSPRRVSLVIAIVLSVVLLASAPTVEAAPCWRAPVDGSVVDPYRAPPCAWCAGNRGIDYAVDGSVAVRASAGGRVVFVGSVAGVRYVVVQLANGWRHTYGQLASTRLELGEVVLAGAAVGRATDRFFFGLRIGDDYADPAPYLGVAVGRRRLVPVDHTPARPAPPPALRCRVGESPR